MSDHHKRIELLANIAIIVVALLIVGTLVRRYLPPSRPDAAAVEAVKVKPGTKLSLSGLDWGKSDKTLLLVISTTCKYCTESAPFYQRLAEQKAGRHDVRLIAVMPQSAGESQPYLSSHNVSVDEFTQARPADVSARATPTLILVDKTGSVVESWVGRLTAEQEAEVVRRLLG